MIGGRSFRQAMFSDLPHEFIRLLARPLQAHEREFSFPSTTNSEHAHKPAETKASSTKTLVTLPREIQLMIFGELEHVENRLALGLTNKYFFTLALSVIHDEFASRMASWAGTNILYVGDGGPMGDYPPGLFSEEEKHAKIMEVVEEHDIFGGEYLNHFRLFHYGSPVLGVVQAPHTWDMWTHFSRCLDRCKEGIDTERSLFERSGVVKSLTENFNIARFYAWDQPWVLRNLTTKEFVRDDAIALEKEFISGPTILGIGFGHALMARICWAPNDSVVIRYSPNITRGVWAGHCFEITTLAKHVEATKGEVWVDVGLQVASEIAQIWTSRYGPDWRDYVVGNMSRDHVALLQPNRAWYVPSLTQRLSRVFRVGFPLQGPS
ncbi:hypothetical protein M434DRAFT_400125 [Hypoxylon sp. CO27-5]|nr:hypothetical protein M434DRAFT_400125 [Hypoxylon sp. CO27-5]